MGHSDTSEEWSGARGVCVADHGAFAVTEKRELDVENFSQEKFPACCELKQVPAQQIPAQRSAAVRAALFALRVYKSYFSLLFAGSCRFEPSCSRYAYEAIERFGVKRGCWLAMKRLLCCQPLSGKFGYDPIPETWEDMHSTKFVAANSQEQTHGCERGARS
jgi:putative membrane protein insertion efficiency factor